MTDIFNIEDSLMVTSPGTDGGLFIVNSGRCTRLSNRATTGLFVADDELIFAYQGDDGKSIRKIKNDSTEIRLAEERMDLHDVLVVEGKIYVVATETNAVIRLDEAFRPIESWKLPGPNDSVHINSIAFYNGRLLASIFGRFVEHRGYKSGTLGLGEVIDVHTGETVISGLSQPHSLSVLGNKLYLCCSEERQLRIYQGAELINQVTVPGYARGLALSGKNLYVGISSSRNSERKDGEFDSAVIAVLNSETMQLKGVSPLPCREIYDIRILNMTGLFPYLLGDMSTEMGQLLDAYQQELSKNESLKEQARLHQENCSRAISDLQEVRSSLTWSCARLPWRVERALRRRLKNT